jgi:hypothetical protein
LRSTRYAPARRGSGGGAASLFALAAGDEHALAPRTSITSTDRTSRRVICLPLLLATIYS